MKWFFDLFSDHASNAYIILVYALVIAAGMMLGKLSVKGVSFGVVCVLFTGILASYWGFGVEGKVLEFIRDFGLVLYIYTMGLQLGPGFFALLKSHGLPLNALSGLSVLCTVGLVVGIFYLTQIPMPVLVGLMSGAVTNTPGLGAAQQTLIDMSPLPPALQNLPSMGIYYALAYPGGVLGIILVMLLIKALKKVDVEKENAALVQKIAQHQPRPGTITLQVQNPSIIGRPVQALFDTLKFHFVVSRIAHDHEVRAVTKETVLHKDDVIQVVASPHDFPRLRTVVGAESDIDLTGRTSPLVSRPVRITHNDVCARPLAELHTISQYGVTITHVERAGIEFIPSGQTRLQFGDVVTLVGEEGQVGEVTLKFGDSERKLKEPHIAGLFVGFALGVLLGSIPIPIPGIATPVKLGLAGGPLVVAILISRYASLLPLTFYVSPGANFLMRELGIALFLASVGLKSGPDFVRMLTSSEGPLFLLLGMLMTIVPLVVTATVARLRYKMNFMALFGLLAGANTVAPGLAFATKLAGSDAPAVTYASVYPLTVFLRILVAQLLIFLFV